MAWTWLLPLLAAGAVFGAVLVATPPGVGAIGEVLVGAPRGPRAEAAAYAVGAAGTLALLALGVTVGVCAVIDAMLRRRRRHP
jgi:hypothetical protein